MFSIEKFVKTFLNIDETDEDITETPDIVSTRKYIDPPNRTYEISLRLQQRDSEFLAENMLSYTELLFREIHKAVSLRELEPIRNLVSKRLYDVLEDLISDEKVDAIEEYRFDSVVKKNYLTSYRVDDKYQYEYLSVCIIMNMPSSEIDYINRLTFRREVDKSARMGLPITRAICCPNCGAALDSIVSTKCAYCQSLIEPAKYDWELLDFEIIKR